MALPRPNAIINKNPNRSVISPDLRNRCRSPNQIAGENKFIHGVPPGNIIKRCLIYGSEWSQKMRQFIYLQRPQLIESKVITQPHKSQNIAIIAPAECPLPPISCVAPFQSNKSYGSYVAKCNLIFSLSISKCFDNAKLILFLKLSILLTIINENLVYLLIFVIISILKYNLKLKLKCVQKIKK